MSASPAAFGPALEAEHAAVFGYGVVGAHLDSEEQGLARQVELAHRVRRDELMARIMTASATPPAAAPAYNLPFAVADREGALRLAIAIEEGAARAWRRALPATSGDDRRLGIEGLMDCAVWATRWRRAAGIIPLTVAFPGAPPTD